MPNIPHGNSVLSGDGANVFAVSRNNTAQEALGPLDSSIGRIPQEVIKGSGSDEGYPVVSFTRVKNQSGVSIQVQVATDLDFRLEVNKSPM